MFPANRRLVGARQVFPARAGVLLESSLTIRIFPAHAGVLLRVTVMVIHW